MPPPSIKAGGQVTDRWLRDMTGADLHCDHLLGAMVMPDAQRYGSDVR